LKKRRKTRRYMINTVTWMHSLLIGSSTGGCSPGTAPQDPEHPCNNDVLETESCNAKYCNIKSDSNRFPVEYGIAFVVVVIGLMCCRCYKGMQEKSVAPSKGPSHKVPQHEQL
jgi:hypothetical protein